MRFRFLFTVGPLEGMSLRYDGDVRTGRRTLAFAGAWASLVGCSLIVDTAGLSRGTPGEDGGGDAPAPGDGLSGLDAPTDAPNDIPGDVPGDGLAAITTPWLAYGTLTGAVSIRVLDKGTGLWSAASPGPSGGFGPVRWIVARQSPSGPVLGIVDVSPMGPGRLSIWENTAGAWTQAFTVPFADPARRGFDIEVDPDGNVMVVYSDGSATARYRRRAAGAWSAEQAIPPYGSLPILWMELAADPRTETMGLAYVDRGSNLAATLWTSSAWNTPVQLEGDITTIDFKCFDLAFERLTGGLLTVWGRSAMVDGAVDAYLKWTRTGPGANVFDSTAKYQLSGKPAGPLVLAPQPGSDQMAVAYIEYRCNPLQSGCDDFITGVWTGTGWTALGSLDGDTTTLYVGRPGSMPVGVGWLEGAGTALAVYHRDLQSGAGLLPFTSYSGGAWSAISGGATGPSLPQRASFAVVPTPQAAVTLIEDVAGELWSRAYSAQGVWADTDQGSPLGSNLAATQAVPFDVAQ
jgi:hypothetical protein